MWRNHGLVFQLPAPPNYQQVSFSGNGTIDIQSVINFAHDNVFDVRVMIVALSAMPQGDYRIDGPVPFNAQAAAPSDQFVRVRFNMQSTGCAPTPPESFPGDHHPELYAQRLFDQRRYPIAISFSGRGGVPVLADVCFNPQDGQVAVKYLEAPNAGPVAERIKLFMEEIRASLDLELADAPHP